MIIKFFKQRENFCLAPASTAKQGLNPDSLDKKNQCLGELQMVVCSEHSGMEEKLNYISTETQEMHSALIGSDMSSGLVKKVAEMDAKIDLFIAEQRTQRDLEEQKRKEKSQVLKGLAAIGATVATIITAVAAWVRGL